MPRNTPAIFWWVVGLSLVGALVPTVYPELDLRVAALFSGPNGVLSNINWWWIQWVNDYIPAVFIVLLGATAIAWLLLRGERWKEMRWVLAFFVVAGILGPGAVVNLGVKDQWNRARPYEVQNFGGTAHFTRAAVITDQCDANCSFVSGHVACGIFLASLALVHRRRQIIWTGLGVASGGLIGLARMRDMAHWLSDVLWAFPITLMASWLVWKLMIWIYTRPWRTVG